MLFNSFEFWIFLPLVLLFSRLLHRRPRNAFLLVSSYLFYMWWDARFVLLIAASTVVDFLVGRALHSARSPARSRLLIVSLAANLGLLGFFKYYNFLAGSLAGFTRFLAPNGAPGHYPAGGDQLLHVPEYVLHHRHLPWEAAAGQEAE